MNNNCHIPTAFTHREVLIKAVEQRVDVVPVVRQDEAHDAVEGGEWTRERREKRVLCNCAQQPCQQQPRYIWQCMARHE